MTRNFDESRKSAKRIREPGPTPKFSINEQGVNEKLHTRCEPPQTALSAGVSDMAHAHHKHIVALCNRPYWRLLQERPSPAQTPSIGYKKG